MKKLSFLASLLMGTLFFAACDADRDDNPKLDLTKTQDPIQLNTPIFAGGTYDLDYTDSIEFTCTAPNYGFPATVTYVVQLSMSEDMAKPNELPSTFSSNRMVVPGKELAIATTKQALDKLALKQDQFPIESPVYVRIRAFIDGVEGSETLSNVIKLNKVRTKFALPDVEMPNPLYVCGKFTDNDWEKAVPSVPLHSAPSTHWRMVYVDQDGILTSPAKAPANYADDYITTTYTSKTVGFGVDDNGKITAATAGWYLMIIDATVDNDKRTMELSFTFNPAEVWLIGTSIVNPEVGILGKDDPETGMTSNCWNETILRTEYEEYVKFETPTEMKGSFVSPQLTSPVDGDGGTRAYVKVKTADWWKSEFFVFDKKIVYRGAGGDQERVNGNKGQRVYLNFSDDTGDLK
jgi:hypothetical protein